MGIYNPQSQRRIMRVLDKHPKGFNAERILRELYPDVQLKYKNLCSMLYRMAQAGRIHIYPDETQRNKYKLPE